LDWGASEEHPFSAVWGYRDGMGDWFVYDEYWNNSQSAITWDHIVEIYTRSVAWDWPKPCEAPVDHPRLVKLFEDIFAGVRPSHSVWHHETFADPSRPGELNEFNGSGITTSMAANDVFQGIDCVRALLKPRPTTGAPRLVIHSRCKHLIEEMRKYRWRKGKKPTTGQILNPAVATPTPLKRDDDTVDALRYMIFSVERGRNAVAGSMSHRDYLEERKSVQLSDGHERQFFAPRRSLQGTFTRS
jgi:hypothetical protein